MGTPVSLTDPDGKATGVTGNPIFVTGTSAGGDIDVVITGPLGQAAMAASIPVVVASNQTAIPENITQTGGNALVNDDAAAGTQAVLPVGGNYVSTLPAYTTGDAVAAKFDANGRLLVGATGITNTPADGVVNSNFGALVYRSGTNPAQGGRVEMYQMALNPAGTWDRVRLAAAQGGLLAELGPYTATRVTADGQIKGSAGFIHTISIAPTGTVTAGVLTIYNSLTETGTVVFSVALPITTFTPFTVTLDVACATGIYVGYDATLANVQTTVSFR